jgi:hypothetical protein
MPHPSHSQFVTIVPQYYYPEQQKILQKKKKQQHRLMRFKAGLNKISLLLTHFQTTVVMCRNTSEFIMLEVVAYWLKDTNL